MDRPVIPYEPTWLDKSFRKDLERLSERDRDDCLQSLGDLISALQSCKHPLTDPNLQPWRPSAYKGIVKIKGGHLAEYRFSGTLRVITCYFEERPEILLVTVTIKHDHDRMKRLLKEHGRSLSSYL